MKLLLLGASGGGDAAPQCKFGTPHISESTRARKSECYTHLDTPSVFFGYENFSTTGRAEGVNLEHPYISKTVRLESGNFTHI